MTYPPANNASGDPTNVASSATAVTLLAANTKRRGAIISNDSTAKLYILIGPGSGTVSSTNYTYAVPAGGNYEMIETLVDTRIITGIWAAANGTAAVTELT